MTILIATTLTRGGAQNDGSDAIFLIDLANQRAQQILRWNSLKSANEKFSKTAPRAIAFDGDRVFVAGDGILFEFDPQLQLVATYECPYLGQCLDISRYRRRLYLVSSDYDSILGFDLDSNAFRWGLHVTRDRRGLRAQPFKPGAKNGPRPTSHLGLNSLHCVREGMFLSGQNTRGLHVYTGQYIRKAATLPDNIENALPYRDGVLFNDTGKRLVRFVPESGPQKVFNVPVYNPELLTHVGDEDTAIQQSYGRGLCVIDDRLIAAGSSPSTVTVYDLDAMKTVQSINLSMDIRTSIYGLDVWPYSTLPD